MYSQVILYVMGSKDEFIISGDVIFSFTLLPFLQLSHRLLSSIQVDTQVDHFDLSL